MKEYTIGILIGLVCGFVLLAQILDNYAHVSKNETGWVVEFEGRIFRLIEID